ncbi:uncharacterized protein MONBRDRAFT_33881 [Monosiga brevicollis MX1]|uniref:Uncharacterized protein n=1 Tax=Monosiga brevicollis TaxID=81824 RepID=A9V851_MONBE|nr:uncharacterized protein MONBRDRAFT_33881 [Monosiga brevicollis MX1]EDQ86210.1 predicted protein [Monosiga brevicollis MX1]|eukprot:XP_001748880.1 hypothetical protein [Monosiga brevicollis MX1]
MTAAAAVVCFVHGWIQWWQQADRVVVLQVSDFGRGGGVGASLNAFISPASYFPTSLKRYLSTFHAGRCTFTMVAESARDGEHCNDPVEVRPSHVPAGARSQDIFQIYCLLRMVLYSLSFFIYVSAQIVDENDNNRNRFAFLIGNLESILIILVFLALGDTILRAWARRVLTGSDIINLVLVVFAIIRLSGAIRGLNGGQLIVPTFLHIWNLRDAFLNLLQAYFQSRESDEEEAADRIISLVNLAVTLVCIILTAAAGVEHLEKESDTDFNFFTAIWFTVVTFSTVGYGDFSPVTYLGRLFVMGMIVVTLIILPDKFSQISAVQEDRKAKGGAYRKPTPWSAKHIVLIMGDANMQTLEDALDQLLYHSIGERPNIVVLCPYRITADMHLLLSRPVYRDVVKYIVGSALVRQDLSRVALKDACAVFILAERGGDPMELDRRTVLRAWAVNDYHPESNLFVQIFLLENIKHVAFAQAVLCMSELRFSLLANTAQCPGATSLITSIAHGGTKIKPIDNEQAKDILDVYESAAANEYYQALIDDSPVFKRYINQNFYEAASDLVEKKICLVGILRNSEIQLNPGANYQLLKGDICLYIARARDVDMIILETDRLAASAEAYRVPRGSKKRKAPRPGFDGSSHGTGPEPQPQPTSTSLPAPLESRESDTSLQSLPNADNASPQPEAGNNRPLSPVAEVSEENSNDSPPNHEHPASEQHQEAVHETLANRGLSSADFEVVHYPDPSSQLPTISEASGEGKRLSRQRSIHSASDDPVFQPDSPHEMQAEDDPKDSVGAASVPSSGNPSTSSFVTAATDPVALPSASSFGNPAVVAPAEDVASLIERDTALSDSFFPPERPQPDPAKAGAILHPVDKSHHKTASAPSDFANAKDLARQRARTMRRSSSFGEVVRLRKTQNDEAEANMDYIVVQVKLKHHAMYHGSPDHECHFVEYHSQTGDARQLVVRTARPMSDLKLSEVHLRVHAPVQQTKRSAQKAANITSEYLESRERRLQEFVIVQLPEGEAIGSGIYHLIRVMRSASLDPERLAPLVLLVRDENSIPERLKRFMVLFPFVYFLEGNLDQPRSLLRACLRGAKLVLVLANYGDTRSLESRMIDSENILTTQNTQAVFPQVEVLTELTQKANVRFIRFTALDPDDYRLAQGEGLASEDNAGSSNQPSVHRRLSTGSRQHAAGLGLASEPENATITERGRTRAVLRASAEAAWRTRYERLIKGAGGYIFRLSFASGKVFTAGMLHSLLFQSLQPAKKHVIPFFRNMLGCDDSPTHIRLVTLQHDLLSYWRIKDYGDVCRYFIQRKREIVLGVQVTRRVQTQIMQHNSSDGEAGNNDKESKGHSRPNQERRHHHGRRLYMRGDSHRHHPSEYWNMHMHTGGALGKITLTMPNPDDEMPIKPGDRVYVLQRRHHFHNSDRDGGESVSVPQKAVLNWMRRDNDDKTGDERALLSARKYARIWKRKALKRSRSISDPRHPSPAALNNQEPISPRRSRSSMKVVSSV